MQSVKTVMRQVGVPNPELGVVSSQELEDHLEYNYLANGYVVQDSHYLGAVRDGSNNEVGYKILFVLVKEEALVPSKAKIEK